jgi:hypothetical protein
MEQVDIEKIPSELIDSYNEQSIYFAHPPLTIELQEVSCHLPHSLNRNLSTLPL